MMRFQISREHAAAGCGNCSHHSVGSDCNDAIGGIESNGLIAELAGSVCRHGLHDIAYKAPILRALREKSRSFVAAPNNDIRGRLDLRGLVAVDHFFVTSEI